MALGVFLRVLFSWGVDPWQSIAPCAVHLWGQLVAWTEGSPLWGSPLGQKVVLPSLLTLLRTHFCPSALSCRILCRWLPWTLTQLCLAPRAQGSPGLAWIPAHQRSSFPPELPAARLSQFPCFPCPSPICTFSLPSSLGSSGRSAVGTLSVVTGSWSALLLPLSQFHSRKVSVISGVFLTPAAGAPCHAGTLEQGFLK